MELQGAFFPELYVYISLISCKLCCLMQLKKEKLIVKKQGRNLKKHWWVISWWLVTNDKIEKANHLAIYFWPGSVWKKKTSLSNRCEAKHWQSMNIYWCTATTWLPQRQEQKMDVTTYWHWSKPLPGIFFYSASMLRIQKVKHQCTCILHIFPLIGVYEHAFFKCRDFENVINMLFLK